MNDIVSRAFRLISVACALITACAYAVTGLPGTLDTTWNGTGKVVTDIDGGTDRAVAMALQPDGKLLLVGECSGDFCVVRYLANGLLDTAWNGTGTVVTPIGGGADSAFSVAIQPDGKVLLAGVCDDGTKSSFCAARYLPGGTLDTTWNSTGTVITAIGSGSASATAMTLQPDGKVLLAGYCSIGTGSNNGFCVARYLSNGTLDTTWNGTGTVISAVGDRSDLATAMALQPDGNVLVAGYCAVGTGIDSDFCAVRYLPNGTLDTTWNGTGKVITPVGSGSDLASALSLQSDGKVLVAGGCAVGVGFAFCAARYLSNGTLDTTWNGTGKVLSAVSGIAQAMTLQPDGKALLAGSCTGNTNTDFCAARFLANGNLDTTWNGTGTVVTPIGSDSDSARAVILQTDGKVLLAGTCTEGFKDSFCAARYDAGSSSPTTCRPDVDGDGSFLATTDALIFMRIALGITGPAVVSGITFPSSATRKTWPLIRDYLVTQCEMSLAP